MPSNQNELALLPYVEVNGARTVPDKVVTRIAEALGKHVKGDALVVVGELQLNVWTTKEGVERWDLQVLCEAIISPRRARVVANGTGKKTAKSKLELEAETTGNPDAFDDEVNF